MGHFKRSVGLGSLTSLSGALAVAVVGVGLGGACGGTPQSEYEALPDASADVRVTGADGAALPPPSTGPDLGDASTAPPRNADGDPTTCDEAMKAKSYVGCDYWPTVVPNLVKNLFDFAVIVSNVGTRTAKITVTGAMNVNRQESVEPGQLLTIYLPWVPTLKGPATGGLTASAVVPKGAFHLVSDSPVIVYQFNALEYKGQGGPPGKDWATCVNPIEQIQGIQCFSYSNDASLLLPSTAMTGNYRVMGQTGWSRQLPGMTNKVSDSTYFAITATEDATDVAVKLSANGSVLAGGAAIAATAGGGTVNFKLGKGDVALVASQKGNEYDLSGSLVTASKPVQVVSGVPCIDAPYNVQACDHIEETVFPAETLGKRYLVNVSTGPKGTPIGHIVRLFGNKDDTTLTYLPSKPASCPATLRAGEVADCGRVNESFEVTGDKEFGVGSIMLGGEILDPGNTTNPKGDPSMSFAVAVEQYRKSYLFLAPMDYESNFVDIAGPRDAAITVDGSKLTAPFTAVSAEYGIWRVKLGSGNNGAHTLTSDKPVGIQVMGYGANTSYQYPGGLNLGQIAPPPVK